MCAMPFRSQSNSKKALCHDYEQGRLLGLPRRGGGNLSNEHPWRTFLKRRWQCPDLPRLSWDPRNSGTKRSKVFHISDERSKLVRQMSSRRRKGGGPLSGGIAQHHQKLHDEY